MCRKMEGLEERKMDRKIEVFIVEPGKPPRIVSMENTMEAAEELLGGTAHVGCF